MSKFSISDPVLFEGEGEEIWEVLIIKDGLIYCPNGGNAIENTREKAINKATKQAEKLNNDKNN